MVLWSIDLIGIMIRYTVLHFFEIHSGPKVPPRAKNTEHTLSDIGIPKRIQEYMASSRAIPPSLNVTNMTRGRMWDTWCATPCVSICLPVSPKGSMYQHAVCISLIKVLMCLYSVVYVCTR